MRTSVARLASEGLVGEALALLGRLDSLSLEERALECELEAIAGSRDRAYAQAEALLIRAQSPGVASRALLVAARIDFAQGRVADGQSKFQRALSAAAESRDAGLVATAHGRRVEALLHFVSLEAAGALIGEYRKAAIRSDQRRPLFDLHRILAEAELKAGRPLRALRELDLAELHLRRGIDALGDAQLDLARGTVLGELGDLAAAYRHSAMAVERSTAIGAAAVARPALNNLAHLETVLGHHDKAASTILRVVGTRSESTGAELAKRATQLFISTVVRDTRTADLLDAQFGPLAAMEDRVPAQWFNLSRIIHLTVNGRTTEAVRLGLASIDRARAASDLDLLARVRNATADALAVSGDSTGAAALIDQGMLGAMAYLPEQIASTHRVSGRLASDSPAAAFDHFARAARIFGHIGHVVGRGEALHNSASLSSSLSAVDSPHAIVPHITDLYTVPPATFGRLDVGNQIAVTTSEAVAQALRASAAMVDLASRPTLAGYEVLSLVNSSGAADRAVLAARSGAAKTILGWTGSDEADRSLFLAKGDFVVFALGEDHGREISVIVRPRNQGSARTTLLALQRLIANAASLHQAAVAESEKSALWPEPLPEQQLGFVCASESMLQLLAASRRVAGSTITVLITGETGTGKELLARAIHNSSPRSKQLFQPFNCTAVAREMLDAQLFGYKRGAFTGAQDAFAGVIRTASGGTLLLDEIGEIGLDVQPKLLRFLESGEVHPLGEPAPVNVDVRVLAATNANLDKMVAEGRFREDLYYRLNVVTLTIPPLRERREEIPLLLDHFLERTQKEFNKSGLRIGETAAEYLLLYAWPGNVRELANEVRRAVALAESGAVLMPEHLSPRIAATRRTVPVGQRPPEATELIVRRDQPLTAAVEHVERALIQDALRTHSSVEDAARALGLSRKGLYLKRQRLKIDE